MADGINRLFTSGQYYYNTNHSRTQLHHRNGSPPSNNRSLFQPNPDTPSPNRSPGTNSPAHNPYSMYNNHNHRQNHGMLNGGAAHQSFQPTINLGKAFQSQAHGHQSHHVNNQHNDHGALGGQQHFGGHQHTISTSTLSNTTPHFTPAHLQNGTPEHATEPQNEHWQEQKREYNRLRTMDLHHRTHFYARNHSSLNRYASSAVSSTQKSEAEENGDFKRRTVEGADDMGPWDAMDLSGQGLKAIAPMVFKAYPKLKKIYLNWNKLRMIPPQIGELRFLSVLDLSMNDLHFLPPEIGMLTNLKRLLLYDNRLDDLPHELGSLYQLEMLGIEGNPMRQDYKNLLQENGTQELIRYLREKAQPPEPPVDRAWMSLVEEGSQSPDTFTVLSWNILCDRAATASAYGYTPSEALAWTSRRNLILDEMNGRRADIMCLQEMDMENYNEFFRPNLAAQDYKGFFSPKSRAQTMQEKEARVVDGPAIFWKNSKYIKLAQEVIVFSREAINRPDMKGEHDVYNRVMPRDHVAIVVFLENRETGSRLIVANTHLTWEPWFSDIKIVQVAILMEQLKKLAEAWTKTAPCKDREKELFKYANEDTVEEANKPEIAPSMKYDDATQIPLLVCGDFNSTRDSGVYDLITAGSLASSHEELGKRQYGNLTKQGMSHPFQLKSAYSHIGELPFTNYTPGFVEVIDWVFYSTGTIQVTSLLGEVDPEYLRRVPGFPNHYFPSDHLALMMEFSIRERKERKAAAAAIEAAAAAEGRRESRN